MTKFEIIKKYIDEFDYYDLLACHAPKDEFDSYSYKLSEEISEKNTIEEIANLIANTLDKAFGNEVNPQKFITTAQKILTDINGIN